jgi:tRNA pseudouridine38-40 synthase
VAKRTTGSRQRKIDINSADRVRGSATPSYVDAMQRWKLKLEYDGSAFLGWQSQPNGRGVQDAVEAAILKVDGQAVRIHAAGRTDTGVHATGQIAHADLEKPWRAFQLREALNAWLRKLGPVSVLEVEPVSDAFHARFSARGRAYLFRILDRRAPLTFDKKKLWHVHQPLDLVAMQEAATEFLGTHDFSTFRDGNCQAQSAIKTLDRFDLSRVDGMYGHQSEIHAHIEARSFLHRQVRSMIGTLAEVGKGYWSRVQLREALLAADRTKCGPVAPGDGLYLIDVLY